MDLGHIVDTLNKVCWNEFFWREGEVVRCVVLTDLSAGLDGQLDCGSPEKLLLMSRDRANVLVVSFSDVRASFERVFGELMRPPVASSSAR